MYVETDHGRWMDEAIREAEQAFRRDETPIGAVVVRDGRIMGRGHNQVESLPDPTAHAEIVAIGAAASTAGDWRLDGGVLYVTAEPCLLCAGAIHWARLAGLVFGANQPQSGVFGSKKDVMAERWYNSALWVERGIREEPCRDLLRQFFEKRRRGARVVESCGLENR